MEDRKYFDTADAALYLGERWGIKRKPSTLGKQRSVGGGPRFRRVGRAVHYERR
jgi:hypothetical protein